MLPGDSVPKEENTNNLAAILFERLSTSFQNKESNIMSKSGWAGRLYCMLIISIFSSLVSPYSLCCFFDWKSLDFMFQSLGVVTRAVLNPEHTFVYQSSPIACPI